MTLPDRLLKVFGHWKKWHCLKKIFVHMTMAIVVFSGWSWRESGSQKQPFRGLGWGPTLRTLLSLKCCSDPGPGPCFCVIHLGGAGGSISSNCAKPGLGTWWVSWQEHWAFSRWHQVLTFAKLLQSENDGKWYKRNEGGAGLNNYGVDRTADV